MSSVSRRRPPPSSITTRPSARTSMRVTTPAPPVTSRRTGAVGEVALGRVEQVRRAAERGDHAGEALGRGARRAARPPGRRRRRRARAARARQRERDADAGAARRGRRAARRSPRAPRARCRRVRPSAWSMSVRSAAHGSPAPSATSTSASASSGASLARGHERARAGLDVHHQRIEPCGELLGQDRRGDQRDRLDRAGDVAERVRRRSAGASSAVWPTIAQPASAHHARAAARARASSRSRGWRRACRACRRCGRGRGPRSSARRPPQAASSGASTSETLSPTPPVECLSSTGPGRSQSSTVPESRIASVSGDALGAAHAAEEDRHRERADLAVADACRR